MIPKRLQERLKTIEGTPLKDRAQAKIFSRRETGSVSASEEVGNEKFDTFFDYEDELSELKSSSEQYDEMINPKPYIVLEDADSEDVAGAASIYTPIVMEKDVPKVERIARINHDSKLKNVPSFTFVQCEFTKEDGNRCKRQAPKSSTLCSAHRKYLENRK